MDALFWQHFLGLSGFSILSGFIASTPIGPVNLWITQALLAKEDKKVGWFVWGVIVSDLVYVFLGFWLYFFMALYENISLHSSWNIWTGVLIMLVGLYSLWKNQQKIQTNQWGLAQKYLPFRAFMTGVLLCASNTMLLVLWGFIAGIYYAYGWEIKYYWEFIPVLGGVLIGDVIWFRSFVKLARRGIQHIRPTFASDLQKWIAIGLVLFGLITACRQLG